jgi:hypothetical protein
MIDRTLKQYVRDRKGNPRGIVVATVIDDEIRLGWSFVNTKAGDSFKKDLGLKIALNRAVRGHSPGRTVQIPYSVNKVLHSMTYRANRYYNNKQLNDLVSGPHKV